MTDLSKIMDSEPLITIMIGTGDVTTVILTEPQGTLPQVGDEVFYVDSPLDGLMVVESLDPSGDPRFGDGTAWPINNFKHLIRIVKRK